MAVVYRHIRKDTNQVFYIGIGKEESRAYVKDAGNRNPYWNRIVSNSDYEVQILFDGLSWEEACEKEIEFISLYGRKDLGLGTLANMTNGGDGGFGQIKSEETRRKMSESHKGQKAWNKGLKTNFSGNSGKSHSQETKLKIGASSKGRKMSPEAIAKRQESRKKNALLKGKLY